MTSSNIRILISSGAQSDAVEADMKMMIETTQRIEPNSWSDHAEDEDVRHIYAPISNDRFIAFRVEESQEAITPNGLITHMAIATSPSLENTETGIKLAPLRIALDFDTMTGPDIAKAMQNLRMIDHEDIDAIRGLPGRTPNASPAKRLNQAIVNVLYHSLPEDQRNDNDEAALFYRNINEGTWSLNTLQINDSSTITIDPANEILHTIPHIIRLSYANTETRMIHAHETMMEDNLLTHDPIQIMEWIYALAELKSRALTPLG